MEWEIGKPRIVLLSSPTWKMWGCYKNWVCGVGITPRAAYEDYIKQRNNMLWKEERPPRFLDFKQI